MLEALATQGGEQVVFTLEVAVRCLMRHVQIARNRTQAQLTDAATVKFVKGFCQTTGFQVVFCHAHIINQNLLTVSTLRNILC